RGIFLTNPWVYSAVTKLARDVARLPLHTLALDDAGERVRVRSDVPTPGPRSMAARLDQVLQNPVGLSRFSFWNGLMIDRLVYGNALAEKLRDGSTSDGIAGLQRVRWRNVACGEEGPDGLPLYADTLPGSSPHGQIRRVAVERPAG